MEINRKQIKMLVLGAMSCIVLYWLLNDTDRVRGILGGVMALAQPFLVGACIAFVLNVPMRAIERQLKKIPNLPADRAFAILLTILVIVMVVALVVNLLIPQVQETADIIAQQLPPFLARVEKNAVAFLEANPQIRQWLVENTDLENMNLGSMAQQAIDLVGTSLGKFVGNTVGMVKGLISSIWSLFVSVIFSLYCLSNKERLARQSRRLLYSFLPEHWVDEIIRVSQLANCTFSNFFAGQCIEVLILGAMFAVTMTILGMPYVPLVSVLGLSKSQIFRKIVLKQVIQRIVPPMSNEIITLIKDTALANCIVVAEIIKQANELAATKALVWPLFDTGVFYLIFVGFLTIVLGKLEKKLSYFRS